VDSSESLALTSTPAAQYLRMSTNQQRLSIESQAAAIEWYACGHNFKVVQTYQDTGRSGLTLNRREGLKQLLQDVFSNAKAFKAILVYDVSRWGRFQDPDEAAHYEFLCKSAGVPVYYCAETFSNDPTLPNAVMKALKRAMAGEYSRELSQRTERAKRIVAERGFRAGGAAGYGLRRMLVSSDRTPKRLLVHGEIASIKDSRVILVPGPLKEVAVVREIYRLAVSERKNTHAIARELNRRRITPPGRYPSWTWEPIFEVLKNPKYMGDAVYGRTTHVLGSNQLTQVPQEKWIVRSAAFKPIIDPETFAAAQRVLRDRTQYKSNEELLDGLRTLLKRERMLTEYKIEMSREVASVRTFIERFGSMKRVYDLIGYVYPESPRGLPSVRKRMWKTRNRNDRLRQKLLRAICKLFPGEATARRKEPFGRPTLYFRNGLRIAVVVVPTVKTPLGSLRWTVPALRALGSDITLLCRCNEAGNAFQDLYLVPSVNDCGWVRIKENDPWLSRGKKLVNLSKIRSIAGFVLAQHSTTISQPHRDASMSHSDSD
jgi:DNA invertase Pin-like site-specific DNA recombinase